MSALAQYLASQGKKVTGSDRLQELDPSALLIANLVKSGARIYPQDGSGIDRELTAVILSTAIEETHPDWLAAKMLGLPIFHRSELLAHFSSQKKSIAVSGTSGKSTVTAMIFEILHTAGFQPSVLSGANIISLKEKELIGNAFFGNGDWLVLEGDESDGSLVRYSPEIGIILNVDRDHKEKEELLTIFSQFARQVQSTLILNQEDPMASALVRGKSTGIGFFESGKILWENKTFAITKLELHPWETRFELNSISFKIPMPGRHNFLNALAATAGALAAGVSLKTCALGLCAFRGIHRRFEVTGKSDGICVVDDFAHNPAKISACLSAARNIVDAPVEKWNRLVAIFQPHGYDPLKFMYEELEVVFSRQKQHILLLLEAYYAGGTADKTVSSADMVESLLKKGIQAAYFPDKISLLEKMPTLIQSGDFIVSMGARDPGLPKFARDIFNIGFDH